MLTSERDSKKAVLTDRLFEKELIRNLLLYGAIGFLSVSVDAILFKILVYSFGIEALFANCFTVSVGITISFFLNRAFNFKVIDRTARRYATFFLVGMCGLLLSELMFLIGRPLGVDDFSIKIVSIFVVALIQFVLNRNITFRRMQER